MSGTARKKRKLRWNKLKKHWDLIGTKALLLGDYKVEAVIKDGFITVRGGDNPSEAWERTCHASTYVLEQMNIKSTSKSRERLRAALMRIRRQ